jgi:hypothetical protein
MVAAVADQIGMHATLDKTPVPVVTLKAIAIPTADNRRQRQIGQRLGRI